MRRTKDLYIGTNIKTNKQVFIKEKYRETHAHIIGSSGSGKTYLLEHMIRQDIKNGRGLCLFDPHGDLYKRVIQYAEHQFYGDRLILIDPNDQNHAVGLNYLEYNPELYGASKQTGLIVRAISKVFGDQDIMTMPQLDRWLSNTIQTLILTKRTFDEAYQLLSIFEPDYRYRLLDQIQDPMLINEWKAFEQHDKRTQGDLIAPVLNRIKRFVASENIRAITLQPKTTIDFRKAMDEGKVILCNLSPEKISKQEANILAVILIDKIIQAAYSRVDIPEKQRKRFYFYMDEFGEYVCDDIAEGLVALRKYGLSFVLAHQMLDQLKEESRKLYSAVMSNTQIKIAFGMSYEDAELMSKEVFAGRFRDDVIKREGIRTYFKPVETTRIIEGHSTASGTSRSTGSSSGSGEGWGSITGTSYQEIPGTGFFPIEGATTHSTTTSSSQSSFSGTSESEGDMDMESESFTEVPFYEFEEKHEGIEDHTLEAIKEKFISWIQNQDPRFCQLKIKGRSRAIPLFTPEVKDVRIREKDIEALREESGKQYSRPFEIVIREIDTRAKALLGYEPPPKQLPPGKPEDFWE